mmetsp:Transcript_4218/g.8288  ORF Transcript_4218/g.8288 Transcript_4218/m.8288 type:complete len:240 (-) Transcript_4218:234-953(-)
MPCSSLLEAMQRVDAKTMFSTTIADTIPKCTLFIRCISLDILAKKPTTLVTTKTVVPSHTTCSFSSFDSPRAENAAEVIPITAVALIPNRISGSINRCLVMSHSQHAATTHEATQRVRTPHITHAVRSSPSAASTKADENTMMTTLATAMAASLRGLSTLPATVHIAWRSCTTVAPARHSARAQTPMVRRCEWESSGAAMARAAPLTMLMKSAAPQAKHHSFWGGSAMRRRKNVSTTMP